MTPQEKAKELLDSYTRVIYNYYGIVNTYEEDAKQCALIAVDNVHKTLGGVWADVAATANRSCKDTLNHQNYWQQVKEEIQKL